MKRMITIISSVLMLIIGLQVVAQTDTNFSKQGQEILVFVTTHESRNNDSLKITSERLLTVWQDLEVYNELAASDYKQLLLGRSVYKKDTSSQTTFTSILPFREVKSIKNIEYQLQGQEIIFLYKPSYYTQERTSWMWTITGVIIPIIILIVYGFISHKRQNKEFILAGLINLAFLALALIASLTVIKISLMTWLLISVIMMYVISSLLKMVYLKQDSKSPSKMWPFYKFYQLMFVSGIFSSWLLVYIMKNPENHQGKSEVWIYLAYFVGLHILAFLIMLSLKRLRRAYSPLI